MARLKKMLSTAPRFGLMVATIGGVLILLTMIQELWDPPHSHIMREIGMVMLWTGLPWAALTAYLGPTPLLNSAGFGFAVLFVLVVPSTGDMELITIVTAWEYMIWGMVCLVILVVVLANLYRGEKERAGRLLKLYEDELKRTGRSPPEAYTPWPKSGPAL